MIGNLNVSKLFSEKLEFYTSVQFNKSSILTGIVKISLKGFLEYVRMCIFGKFGLQQMQVDIAYLQIYMWRFVTDESLVNGLLEEIITNTITRCIDPVLMESSVVNVVCEAK